jgi:hypothetical protein
MGEPEELQVRGKINKTAQVALNRLSTSDGVTPVMAQNWDKISS